MVILVEYVRDGLIGFVQIGPAEVHGDLPGNDDIFRAALAEELGFRHIVLTAHGVDDEIHGELPRILDIIVAFQGLLDDVQRDLAVA